MSFTILGALGWKPPNSGIQIYLLPSAAGYLVTSLTCKRQHFDDAAIGSTELAGSEDNSTEFVIAQDAIPRDLLCR